MNLALDPTRSVSVEASAGSGKTWQLVSRILRLLLSGAEPGGILALTFTRKAAAEMRERVEARVRELAYADEAGLTHALRLLDLDGDETLRRRARALHEQLLFAPFGLRAQTLHAFCQDLLTRFPVEANVPAGFTLVENERQVQARAMERLLEGIRMQPERREAKALDTLIALDATEPMIRAWLKGFVDRRSDWWAFTERWLDDGEDAIAAAATQLARDLEIDPDDDGALAAAFDTPEFIENLRQLQALLVDCKGLGQFTAALLSDAVVASDATSRGAAAQKLFTNGERRKLKTKKGVSDTEFGRCVVLYESLCDVIERVREQRLRHLTWQRTNAVWILGAALLEELAAALRAAQALTFADLEWRSYRLLSKSEHSDWVRYKLDCRIEHLLLDEFQDTSPTQWSLLLPLLDEIKAGDPERARTAFVVGDAKQSIYGFRRANPELIGVAARFVADDLRGDAMPLNESRRSAPAIIAFVNALFAGSEGRAIGFETHGTWRRDDWGAVEIAPLVRALDADEEDAAEGLRYPLTTPRKVAEDLRLQTEARQIAERIRALVDEHLPILDDDAPRALGYGDVMILARQRTHLHAIERALAARSIPFVGSSKGSLLETVIARDLMALLRFLDAPHRDLELAQTLRSPLFAASDDDLIRLAQARAQGANWWQRLCSLAAEGTASTALISAARLIEGWLAAARYLPAHDLLDRIDHQANAAARYEAALPGDAQVRANLGAFLQLVLDVDQGRYPTLGGLNRTLAELAGAGKDAPDEAPPPAEAGAVRVLTVHASKGLEAPAVFLVNSAPTPISRSDGWLVDWPSGAGQPRHSLLAGKSDARDALSRALAEKQKVREVREALNLLYVAVTRARQFLFVSAFESRRGDAQASWHGACRAAVEGLAGNGAPLPGALPDAVGYRSGHFPVVPANTTPPASAEAEDSRLRQPFALSASESAPSFDAEGLRDADSAARGIAIHWLLQRLAEHRGVDEAFLPERLSAMLGEPADPAQVPLWLAEAQHVLAAPALARFFDDGRIRKSWNEVPVQALVSGELQSGVIDRLVDDGDTLWILDYKTAPRPQPDRLVEYYRPQLAAYANTVAALWPGRAIVSGLIATATASWIEVLRR